MKKNEEEIKSLKDNMDSKIYHIDRMINSQRDAKSVLKLMGMKDGFEYCRDMCNDILERQKPDPILLKAVVAGAIIGTLLSIITSIYFF